jgi:hypothetical protein
MLKALVVTDEYALCDKCGGGAKPPDDPIVEIGSKTIGLIRLHKSCFDVVAAAVNEICDNWKKYNDNPRAGF